MPSFGFAVTPPKGWIRIWGRPQGIVARWSPPQANHDAVYIQVRAAARGRRTAIDLATEQHDQIGGDIESIVLDGEQAVRVWNAEKGISAVGVTHGEVQYLITCAHAPKDRRVLDAFCASWKFTDVVPLSQDLDLDRQRLRVDRFTIQFPAWVRWVKEDFGQKVKFVGWFANSSFAEMPPRETFAVIIDIPADIQRLDDRRLLEVAEAMLRTMASRNQPANFRRMEGFKDRLISDSIPSGQDEFMYWQAAIVTPEPGTRVLIYFNSQCDTREARAAFAKLTESILGSIKPAPAKPPTKK